VGAGGVKGKGGDNKEVSGNVNEGGGRSSGRLEGGELTSVRRGREGGGRGGASFDCDHPTPRGDPLPFEGAGGGVYPRETLVPSACSVPRGPSKTSSPVKVGTCPVFSAS